MFGTTASTKCSSQGGVAKILGTLDLVCFSIFILHFQRATQACFCVKSCCCPGVSLPICSNMTHILFHYCKLPADRFQPNCPPEGWDGQLWDRPFNAQRQLAELQRLYYKFLIWGIVINMELLMSCRIILRDEQRCSFVFDQIFLPFFYGPRLKNNAQGRTEMCQPLHCFRVPILRLSQTQG